MPQGVTLSDDSITILTTKEMLGTSFKVTYSEYNRHITVSANAVSNSQQITITYEDKCNEVSPVSVSFNNMETSVLRSAEEQSFEVVQVGVETFTADELDPLICGNVVA